MVRKYNDMMNKDLAKLRKETEEEMNASIGHKTASIREGAESQLQKTVFGKYMKCSI